MAPRIIAVVGGLVTDLITIAERIPDNGETLVSKQFSQHPGGKGANSAVAAYRLSHNKPTDAHGNDLPNDIEDGIQVRMTGAVGDDTFGPSLTKKLEENHVDTSGIRNVPGKPTGVGVVVVTDNGENRILYNRGANDDLQPEDVREWEDLAGGFRPDLLISQIEIQRETVEQALRTALKEGIDVLLNPAPASHLFDETYKGLTHLVVNETEAAILSLAGSNMNADTDVAEWGKVAEEFLEKGVRNVVITLGAKGAYYSDGQGKSGHMAAEQIEERKVKDTTGAGDTFVGAYGVEYVNQKSAGEWDIEQAVRFACKASARTIQAVGALEAIPWLDEVLDPAE
ncbi:MAG: hypothetical protein L6R38_001373 [Xanthoria sp. 2 TBL-2021]|nr:MAG: hypothetical protein L6R38_001373 [Xanthoria sp. 2 TBL-2021]